MKALIAMMILLTQVALADTYNYQLYYDEAKTEKLDIKVELLLTEKFERGSKVVALRIWGMNKRPVLLFNVSGNNIKAEWTSAKTLKLSSIHDFESLVKKEYIPAHSDTFINPDELYSFEALVLNEQGTLTEDQEGFYLANQSVEEMALQGVLK